MSTKTDVAPESKMVSAVATKVKGVVIILSSGSSTPFRRSYKTELLRLRPERPCLKQY